MHPILFRLGSWPLSSYFALLSLAGLVSLGYFKSFEAKLGLGGHGDFWLLTNLVVFSGLVGGWVLAACLRRASPETGNFWTGGLPTYGVLAGVGAGVWFYCQLRHAHFLRTLDYVFVVVPLCHGIARLGCFLAGCCYGRPADPHLPWAVIFHDAHAEIPGRLLGVPLYPTQLFEAAGDFVLAGFLGLFVLPRMANKSLPAGSLGFAYLAGYGLVRFTVDCYRGDTVAVAGLGVSPAQILSLVAVGAAAVFWRLPRAAGQGPASLPRPGRSG